jgi:hypothetical protein
MKSIATFANAAIINTKKASINAALVLADIANTTCFISKTILPSEAN